MSDETSYWNHFLPQHYLKLWSGDGLTVNAHELLVPHEKVPPWRPQPIRSAGAHQHLYTSILDPERADAFERWLNREVEQPAISALEKLRDGRRLTRAE